MADILLVEDDDDLAFLTQAVLELEGHSVRRAENGERGLACMTEALPDLVVLDVEMPILDGPAMAARMFAENCGRERIPLVFASGAVGLDHIAHRVGTPYWLAKPVETSRLREVVRRALRERRAPRPAGAATTDSDSPASRVGALHRAGS